MTTLPRGFRSHVANIGVKDDTDDFVVIAADSAVPVAGVFTRSRFAGPSVTLSRAQIADGRAHAVVVISKNANVATGPQGHADAVEVAQRVADRLGCEPTDVVVTSTGVIGRRYPIERIRAGIDALPVRAHLRRCRRSGSRDDDHRHGPEDSPRPKWPAARHASSGWPRASG